NDHLLRFCQANQVTFTRSRAGKKNDNCYVEQKNWSVVRRLAGYGRLETDKELNVLNQIYDVARLYHNFFQPSLKLLSKERLGAKVIKRYDEAKTPYQRALASDQVEQNVKERLRETFTQLNPAELKRKIMRLHMVLSKASAEAEKDILIRNVTVSSAATFL
ncbi:MAG: ISNCY family transposase, partial [Firmicutes bacterium]|nr:ISNCY family transposase [Bacillota bacterium]